MFDYFLLQVRVDHADLNTAQSTSALAVLSVFSPLCSEGDRRRVEPSRRQTYPQLLVSDEEWTSRIQRSILALGQSLVQSHLQKLGPFCEREGGEKAVFVCIF